VFNKYYEDELAFLRELGAEFSRANPAAAPYLAERAADPDVERLLEGFAFLTGKLRQKLDDELPELIQSVMQLLWPHYLRPVPPLTLLQFDAQPHMVREPQLIPRGTEVDSVPVEGTPCRFRTCGDVRLLPLTLETAEAERPVGSAGHLRLQFRVSQGAKAEALDLGKLRLFLHGEPTTTYALFLQLTRRLKEIVVAPVGVSGRQLTLPPDSLKAGGFGEEDALIPYPPHAFPGYRLLQEYFALPQKFLFLDLEGLPRLGALGATDAFDVRFVFSRPPESPLRLGTEVIRLHCVPAVNLFEVDSDPIRVDHHKVEYLIRPSGINPAHAEVFSIDGVKGWVRGTVEPRAYPSFYSFRHGTENAAATGTVFYHSRIRPSVVGRGVDTYASFVTAEQKQAIPPTETVVMSLTCTNRHLPAALRIGDVSRATSSSPQFAQFRNIAPVSASIPPPLGGELHWRLISNLSLNYLSLASVEGLRTLLAVYNFPALQDRVAAREGELRLAGIQNVQASAEERLLRGSPVRGCRIEIEMKEDHFAGEGEMVLFAGVLHEFLSLYCTVNSFVHLVVRGVQHGETYEWNPRMGRLSLV
jgi:type VI secretion system protein ImpG